MSEPTLFAAPTAAAHAGGGGGALEITLALLLIVALIAGLAWFTRRMRGGFARGSAARIQVLGAQALGPKERAVLVRIGNTDILVGVAAGAVNTLHVFPNGANTDAPPPATPAADVPNFKNLLLKALGK
jgi:flagellar protein FliO/FliZ